MIKFIFFLNISEYEQLNIKGISEIIKTNYFSGATKMQHPLFNIYNVLFRKQEYLSPYLTCFPVIVKEGSLLL